MARKTNNWHSTDCRISKLISLEDWVAIIRETEPLDDIVTRIDAAHPKSRNGYQEDGKEVLGLRNLLFQIKRASKVLSGDAKSEYLNTCYRHGPQSLENFLGGHILIWEQKCSRYAW